MQWLKMPTLKSEIASSSPALVFIHVSKKQNVSWPLNREDCPRARPRGSVLGLRSPGLEFSILSLEGSVISPSSVDSPGPV